MGKTHRKNQPQGRTRTTRSAKPRLVLSDPGESSAQLTDQLSALGLYAANTLGDGNCLFRALSDQLYGTPSKHATLRQDICDWIVKHKSRYEPFVEDERGLDVHIKCMRENGTYGGHMELSSFAHMSKRDVKVIQPGLVYVIEWSAGLDEEEQQSALRQLERERDDDSMSKGTIYVAYHDWEHFSSIRNLRGPHSGLPNVTEAPAAVENVVTPKEREREAKRERERERKEKEKLRRITRVKLKLPAPAPAPAPSLSDLSSLSTLSTSNSLTSLSQDPTEVPLPDSALTSLAATPVPEVQSAPLSAASTQLSVVASPSSSSLTARRSPKRSFDESTSSEDGQSILGDLPAERGRDKRSRLGSVTVDCQEDARVEREETPGLSAPGSSTSGSMSSVAEDEEEKVAASLLLDDDGYSSLSELESLSPSPRASPAPPPPTQRAHPYKKDSGEKPLTRRQRKALGLPKPRAALVFGADNNSPGAGRVTGAGKIVIPGGRFKGRGTVKVREFREGEGEEIGRSADGSLEEWVRNGVGRVDVRGFRELKI